MTAKQLVDKQIATIKVLDGNTEIHHLYLYVKFQGRVVWAGGSNDRPGLIATAWIDCHGPACGEEDRAAAS